MSTLIPPLRVSTTQCTYILADDFTGVTVSLRCVSFSHLIGSERKYSVPIHHTTEHIPEKKFKSEALLSTLTSDASKENTPGQGTVGLYSLQEGSVLTAVCVCGLQVVVPTVHPHLPTMPTV